MNIPATPEALVGYILRNAASRLPNVQVSSSPLNSISLNGRRLSVAALMKVIAQDRAAWQERLWEYLSQGAEASRIDPQKLCFGSVRSSLFPAVRSTEIFKRVEEPHVAYEEFVPGAVCLLLYNLPTATITVSNDMLSSWGVAPKEAMEIAKRNVTEATRRMDFRGFQWRENGRYLRFEWSEGTASAIPFSDHFQDVMRGVLGQNFWLAVPASDEIWVWEDRVPALHRCMCRTVRRIHHDHPTAQLDRPLLATLDGYAVVDP